MKSIAISFLLFPIVALGFTPMPNYPAIYEKADIFVEGHLSGRELNTIKVSSDYDSSTGAGHDQFYIMTELIVDDRIQFNGQLIAPDGYLEINGKEKEFYRVYAKDGAHLNAGNIKETKAWFISRSALPTIDSIFCLGTYQIDYAERNISEYMTGDLGNQEASQNIRKKKEYSHGADLLLSLNEVDQVTIQIGNSKPTAKIFVSIPLDSIVYQIRKNPNMEKELKPLMTTFDVYIDDHLIARSVSIVFIGPPGSNNTILSFGIDHPSEFLNKVTKLIKTK